jgi:hypothetical protein
MNNINDRSRLDGQKNYTPSSDQVNRKIELFEKIKEKEAKPSNKLNTKRVTSAPSTAENRKNFKNMINQINQLSPSQLQEAQLVEWIHSIKNPIDYWNFNRIETKVIFDPLEDGNKEAFEKRIEQERKSADYQELIREFTYVICKTEHHLQMLLNIIKNQKIQKSETTNAFINALRPQFKQLFSLPKFDQTTPNTSNKTPNLTLCWLAYPYAKELIMPMTPEQFFSRLLMQMSEEDFKKFKKDWSTWPDKEKSELKQMVQTGLLQWLKKGENTGALSLFSIIQGVDKILDLEPTNQLPDLLKAHLHHFLKFCNPTLISSSISHLAKKDSPLLKLLQVVQTQNNRQPVIEEFERKEFEQAIKEHNEFKLMSILNKTNLQKSASLIGFELNKYAKDFESQEYAFLIKIATKKYPWIKNYIFNDKKDSILKIPAIKIMVDLFQKKTSNLLTTHICDHFNLFKRKLEEIQPSLLKGQPHCFIVKHPNSLHVTPIFVRKDEKDQLKFYILDSTGIYQNYTHDCKVKILSIAPQAEITYFTLQRQFDESNCPIFALRDLVQASKNPSLFDGMDKAKKEVSSSGSSKIFQVDQLPPYMMKGIQSEKAKKAYIKSYESVSQETNLINKKGETESLENNIARHSIKNKKIVENQDNTITTKPTYNIFIDQRFWTYQALVIGKVIELGITSLADSD